MREWWAWSAGSVRWPLRGEALAVPAGGLPGGVHLNEAPQAPMPLYTIGPGMRLHWRPGWVAG